MLRIGVINRLTVFDGVAAITDGLA